MSKVLLQVHYTDSGLTTEEEFKSIPRTGEIITRVSDEGLTKYRVETRVGTGHGEDASEPVLISVTRIEE